MKRALLPMVWIAGAIVVLIAVMYWYEQKWGTEGPFEDTHTHGHEGHDHHDHDGHQH